MVSVLQEQPSSVQEGAACRSYEWSSSSRSSGVAEEEERRGAAVLGQEA